MIITEVNNMKLYIVMSWGSDDVPIGIFDDINKAKECAKRNNTRVYTMNLNEELENKKKFFERGIGKGK